MIDSIINADIERQKLYEIEKQVLRELSFKEILEDLFLFHEKDKTLYVDFRTNTKKTYAVNFFQKNINRKTLHIYHIYKHKVNTKLYLINNQSLIKKIARK